MQMAKGLRPVSLALILCASHSRTFSLIHGYSAPIEIYKHLDLHDDVGTGESLSKSSLVSQRMLTFFLILRLFTTGAVLCVGSEWHRFPSSFFIPDYIGEVRWIDDGFRGLLPFPFNSTLGGTAAAPPYFNNKNKASDLQYVITC